MPSSAEPAHPEPVTPGPPGRILHFAQRTLRGGHGRRTPHPQPAEEPAVVADTPQQRLAETAEAWFLARGMTLTDPDVADTYRATLDLVRLMHEGSQANGIIGDDELRHLAGMIEGLRNAPDTL
ncbi:hypothetical protein AB0G98_21410 [Streptomyces sp. NPDC020196]|uniref:hypothetical protein n=1 Tax=Streptomyces sp. NPDC020196 TaxID=3156656 RepID=UPI0033E89B1E